MVWMPVLLVASLLYWTVALGLGGLSLMAVSGLSGNDDGLMLPSPGYRHGQGQGDETSPDTATEAPDRYDPIVVHLEESAEPEDVDDNVGCAFSFEAQDGQGPGDGERDPTANGPGNTAF
jgi:hypothetical protein